MELKCPSLDYVYSMTWAEFQIRAFAYKREQEKIDYRFRELGWRSMWSFHSDPKKLPKKINQYWEIGEQKSDLTEAMRERIKQAQEQYKRDLNG